jgi:hypothetical protein
VRETERFVNEGRGWECRRCRSEGSSSFEGDEHEGKPSSNSPSSNSLARFFREGEAEGGGPRLSSTSLARWKDETRSALVCPRCGAEEELKD